MRRCGICEHTAVLVLAFGEFDLRCAYAYCRLSDILLATIPNAAWQNPDGIVGGKYSEFLIN